ncbi:nuclear transport factor 2 family protein [Cohnella soli]|uniref:Nuclear transport factor 2 family protein n=1 Tax=Cohnella soli TaxID=425005 RepID=A0ABW0I449_9BACL
MNSKLATAEAFFRLAESHSDDESQFRSIIHPDFEQTEYPNLYTPRIRIRDLSKTVKDIALSRRFYNRQTYEIIHSHETEDHLILEVLWEAIIKNNFGKFKKDEKLQSRFCSVIQYRNNLIYRQRSYDCFEATIS